MARVLAWLAFGLFASGVILGLLPLKVADVKCGSLFTGEPSHHAADDGSDVAGNITSAACGQLRAEQWRTVTPLLVVGISLVLASATTVDVDKRKRQEQVA